MKLQIPDGPIRKSISSVGLTQRTASQRKQRLTRFREPVSVESPRSTDHSKSSTAHHPAETQGVEEFSPELSQIEMHTQKPTLPQKPQAVCHPRKTEVPLTGLEKNYLFPRPLFGSDIVRQQLYPVLLQAFSHFIIEIACLQRYSGARRKVHTNSPVRPSRPSRFA